MFTRPINGLLILPGNAVASIVSSFELRVNNITVPKVNPYARVNVRNCGSSDIEELEIEKFHRVIVTVVKIIGKTKC